jgi:peptide/nickel transport system substrate-binding protein
MTARRPNGFGVGGRYVDGRNGIDRRTLLKLAAAAGGVAALEACNVAPTSTASSAPTPTQVAGTAGKYKLGVFEYAEFITDPAKFPKTFKEAPELAAQVTAGKLPKVADRIGQDPIVIKPIHGNGKYGGTMHKAFIGTADGTAFRFLNGPDAQLWYDPTGAKVIPWMARSFDLSADGKVLTIQMRRGLRWSNGDPVDADDVIFWYQDMYLNKEISGGITSAMQVNGKPVTIEKIDQFSYKFVSPDANYLMPDRVASASEFTGQYGGGNLGYGLTVPSKYLKKIHPKYAGQAAVDKLAADAKFKSWTEFYLNKTDPNLNPDLPTLSPWHTTRPMNDPALFTADRNPYSVFVDTDGNQLPYINQISHAFAQDTDAIALKIVAGELDFQDRYLPPDKLPVYFDGAAKGNYTVGLDPQQQGLGIALNLAYVDDKEIGDLLRTTDFRRALSMGLDRDQINEAFFLGTGTVGAAVPADTNKYFPGKEYRTKWATLDIAQANSLLDKLGYTNKSSSGIRQRKDGKGDLTVTFTAVNRLANFPQMAEMIKQQWAKIGVNLQNDTLASSAAQTKLKANQTQMVGNTTATDDVFITPGYIIPIGGGYSAIMGIPFAQWINSGGAQGTEPFKEMKDQIALWQKGFASPEADRITIGKQLQANFADQVFAIGIITQDLSNYGVRIQKSNLENVPGRFVNLSLFNPTVNALPQTWYFK